MVRKQKLLDGPSCKATASSHLSGPFKKLVHAGLYVLVITFALLMQLYTESIKYQMRKMAIGQSDEGFKGVIRKTGIFTIFAVTMVTTNLAVNTFFPDKSKNQEPTQ